MYFQFRFCFSNQRTNFQHVSLEDSALFTVEMQSVVFQERTTFRHTLAHEPCGAVQSGGFPVTFCTETITFFHQTLRSQSRNLVKVTEVVEVGSKCFGTCIFQDTTESDFCFCRVPHFGISFCSGFFQFRSMVIFFEVSIYHCLYIFVFHCIVVLHQVVYRTVVYVVTQNLFSGYLVTISNSNVVHLVTETDNQHILCISPSSANTHPCCNLTLCFFILPVSYHYLTVFTHTGYNVAEFTVTMSRLVQVHKVHIHGIPRNFFVELSMEVQQRLLQFLQTVNPHLGRRESVHPGDNADTFLIIVSSFESFSYFFRRVYCPLINHLYRQFTAGVQSSYHFITVCVYCDNCVTSVQELCSGYEPYFILIKCVHNVLIFNC